MNDQQTTEIGSRVSLGEAAARWWVILHDDRCSPADYRQFAKWVSHSPDRIESYLRIIATMRALEDAEHDWAETTVEELISEIRAEKNIARLPDIAILPRGRRKRWRKRRHVSRWLSGLAAVLALVVGLALFKAEPQSYETGVGEQLTVQLDDGSVMALNTASRVLVKFNSNHRKVHLLKGEVLFNVAPDSRRPFHVNAGIASIQAVGTAFNVDRREDRTTVTVVEGHVLVQNTANGNGTRSSVEQQDAKPLLLALTESDQLIVGPSGVLKREHLEDVTAVTAWTQRRLVFDGQSLIEVAAEFNRYNQIQIRIVDPELSDRLVTGTFQADDPRSFLAFVSQITGTTVRERNGVHTVVVQKKVVEGGQTD